MRNRAGRFSVEGICSVAKMLQVGGNALVVIVSQKLQRVLHDRCEPSVCYPSQRAPSPLMESRLKFRKHGLCHLSFDDADL